MDRAEAFNPFETLGRAALQGGSCIIDSLLGISWQATGNQRNHYGLTRGTPGTFSSEHESIPNGMAHPGLSGQSAVKPSFRRSSQCIVALSAAPAAAAGCAAFAGLGCGRTASRRIGGWLLRRLAGEGIASAG